MIFNPRFLPFILISTLPLHAVEFPKPDPEQAFGELKIYDADGRPWRAAREDWDRARRLVKEDFAWSTWLETERRAVEHWMSRTRDRVEWAAGWSHDGVSPKDGSRLIWTEEVPGEEVQSFRSPSDPEVSITPKTFAWWVVSNRGRNLETMVRAARLYRITGDRRFAEWSSGQVDFYADNFLKWEPARGGARLFWQTLTEATNLIKFTETTRLLGDYVEPDRLQRWRDQLFMPEVEVLNGTYQNIHNIACWQRGSVAQVALLFGDDAMWREAIDGPFGIRRQVAEGITSDYLWHEQSFGYNGYVVQALASLFIAAGIHGRADELAHEMATAENLMLSTTYYRFPNGDLPNPADSGGIGSAPNRKQMGAHYRVFPTAWGLAAIEGTRSWDTLLDPPPMWNGAQPPLPEVTSRSLETSRMAILKDGPWQVFMHYGQLTRSHTESEALNFSAFFEDTDITHDPGTVGYGSPLHRGYHTRGLGHNALLVNGEGEDLGVLAERREWIIEHADPVSPLRGELLEFSVKPARVTAAQPRYRNDARAQRTLAIEGDTLVDSATIVTRTTEPQKLGLALHLQGRVHLPDEFRSDPTFSEGRPEPYQYWHDASRASFQDRVTLDVAYGALVMQVTLDCPGKFTLWHASTPDVPPHRRESLYLETTGTEATFTTTFRPKR